MLIKLHAFTDGEEFCVNAEKISCVRPYGNGSQIAIEGYGIAKVAEDMTAIMQLMVNSYFEKKEGEING